MPEIVYNYEIPDPARPVPPAERGLGPSGHLIRFLPLPLSPAEVIGRKVDELSEGVGTYGMGGPGFFGLRFESEWLVIAIWGAAQWMSAKGRQVGDARYA